MCQWETVRLKHKNKGLFLRTNILNKHERRNHQSLLYLEEVTFLVLSILEHSLDGERNTHVS